MEMNKSMFKSIIAWTLLLLMVAMLPSCSFNKDDAEFELIRTEFEYYEETNVTLVKCDVRVTNGTAYDIDSFDVEIGVYSNGECISSESRHYDYRVQYDWVEYESISFTVEGNADYAALVTWTPNYEPFWKVIFNILENI